MATTFELEGKVREVNKQDKPKNIWSTVRRKLHLQVCRFLVLCVCLSRFNSLPIDELGEVACMKVSGGSK